MPDEKEPLLIALAKYSQIDEKPVTITLDLGGNVWTVATLGEGPMTRDKNRQSTRR